MSGTVGVITSEAIERLRKRIGKEHTGRNPYNEEATKDAIRHYAEGIGDNNPLWLDEEYARKSRYGGIIAPPLFVQTMVGVDLRHSFQQGLPGAHALHVGMEYRFFSQVRVGDRMIGRAKLIDIQEKFHSGIADHTILQIHQTGFINSQTNEIVASQVHKVLRFERDASKEKGKYSGQDLHHYTKEELLSIEADRAKEERRGAVPRFWEDVNVGDTLPPIVKGPLRVTDIILFIRGWGNVFAVPYWEELAYRRKHPAVIVPNRFGIPDVPERIHWEDEFAQSVMGFPAAIDYGTLREAWFCQLFTNWMGDDGFLKQVEVHNWKINVVGDTSWVQGKVTDKYVKDGEWLVECEGWIENQRKDTILRGTAVIALPSKEAPEVSSQAR